jgi:hypothetical protein
VRTALCIVLAASSTALAAPGRIVVNADEWTLSNSGDWSPAGCTAFAPNIAAFLTGMPSGASMMVYSENFGLTGSILALAMIDAGHAWTVGNAQPFTLGLLMQYDAVFVGGRVSAADPDPQVLIDYVNAGGNVFIMGGCGYTGGYDGNPVVEAAAWNPFLNAFGLAFSTAYDAGSGSFNPDDTDHPIFAGVDALYQSVGQGIIDLDPDDAAAVTFLNFIVNQDETRGRYAVYDGANACPADLAAPFGTLNFFDVSAFLALYNAHDPAADLAAPFGAWNFFDVSAFLAAYNAGCP